MANIGFLNVILRAKSKIFDKKMKKSGRNVGKFGKLAEKASFRLKLLGVAMAGAAVAGVVTFMKKASDMQEVMAKFDVVFDKNSKAVKAWSDATAEELGRSQKQIASFMAGTQDLLVPAGLDPTIALGLSKQVTKLAVDLGSFNNLADETVMRDLQAALTGSGETMKKYGVIVSEASVKQELLNKGLSKTSASDADKVMARLAIIMRGTVAAQGDAVRSGGAWANLWRKITSRVDDFAAMVGSKLLPYMEQVAGEFLKWIDAGDGIEGKAEAVGNALKSAFDVAIVSAKVLYDWMVKIGAGAKVVGLGLAGMVIGGPVGAAIGAGAGTALAIKDLNEQDDDGGFALDAKAKADIKAVDAALARRKQRARADIRANAEAGKPDIVQMAKTAKMLSVLITPQEKYNKKVAEYHRLMNLPIHKGGLTFSKVLELKSIARGEMKEAQAAAKENSFTRDAIRLKESLKTAQQKYAESIKYTNKLKAMELLTDKEASKLNAMAWRDMQDATGKNARVEPIDNGQFMTHRESMVNVDALFRGKSTETQIWTEQLNEMRDQGKTLRQIAQKEGVA